MTTRLRSFQVVTCSDCPDYDHRGAFAAVACVPVCRALDRDLPHKVVKERGRDWAQPTTDIPDWCPLPKADW